MEREKEIITQILAIHDGNKLLGKQDNLDDFVKIIYNYKHNIEEQKKYIQPDDRTDNPHHHNNRID